MRRHWTAKEEALDGTIWKAHFERGYGPVIRQFDDDDDDDDGGDDDDKVLC